MIIRFGHLWDGLGPFFASARNDRGKLGRVGLSPWLKPSNWCHRAHPDHAVAVAVECPHSARWFPPPCFGKSEALWHPSREWENWHLFIILPFSCFIHPPKKPAKNTIFFNFLGTSAVLVLPTHWIQTDVEMGVRERCPSWTLVTKSLRSFYTGNNHKNLPPTARNFLPNNRNIFSPTQKPPQTVFWSVGCGVSCPSPTCETPQFVSNQEIIENPPVYRLSSSQREKFITK